MRVAVLADIHSNSHALDAVLREVERRDADRVVVLGDLVGYGARPREVIERVREAADVVALGNHDHGVGRPMAAGTRASAKRAVAWTRERLGDDQRAYLAGLPKVVLDPSSGLLCAHGCYLNEEHYYGYVTSTMLGANLEAIAARGDGNRVALCGHTHVPMLACLDDDGVTEVESPDGTWTWPEGPRAVIVNPGAVGQPRDGDLRASFALIDPDAREVELVRVPYDVEAAAGAIQDAGLPSENAERLMEGR